MLRLALIFISVALFSSCTKPTGIKDLVLNSDSAAINFFKGNGSRDTVIKVVILKDKKQLQSLAGFIESDRTTDQHCGYDGSLHFFKDNIVIQDVSFRMNEADCMHFSFSLDGLSFQTKLSANAKAFFQTVLK